MHRVSETAVKIQRYKDTKDTKDMERRKKPSAGRLSDRAELSDRETYEALQELESPLWRDAWEDVGKFE